MPVHKLEWRRSALARLRVGWLTTSTLLFAAALACPVQASDLTAGFRYSVYGPDYDPGPDYWAEAGEEMAGRFAGSVSGAIWIVGQLDGEGCRLSFPAAPESPLIKVSERDNNERMLLLFDRLQGRVWLQVEPGNAPVEELIDLVLERYGHHPSVVGVGIDVEWYKSTEQAEGMAVSDGEARAWLATARAHDSRFRLFLKHWEIGKMPPTVREGLLFVDDSQYLPSADAMVAEFAAWGRAFAPAPVAFQYGYDSDRPWWRYFADPALEIGQRILAATPNTEGLFWVDFTILDVFPLRPIVGVKIYDHEGNFEELVDSWRAVGINTAFVSKRLAADRAFRQAAAARDIPVFLIAPVFYSPEALEADPELFAVTAEGEQARDDWVEFTCPSRRGYRDRRRKEIVDLTRELKPQGVSLDFIRHFVFWERVPPEADADDLPNTCFCSHCLAGFGDRTGIEVPPELAGTPAQARWVLENHGEAWASWKVELISSMVEEIATEIRRIDPEIRINIHAVPWRRDDYDNARHRIVGQDLSALSTHVDYISPMTYWFMLERPFTWVGSVVREMAAQASVPILPSVQVETAYRQDAEISSGEFWLATHSALAPPSRGVVFWSWEALARNPEKLQLLAEALRARHPRP